MSHWTGTRDAPEPFRGVLDRKEEKHILFRETFITTREGMDYMDRCERCGELASLGGLSYVRAVRQRIAAVRAAKYASGSGDLRLDEWTILPPVSCRRTRDRQRRKRRKNGKQRPIERWR